MFIGDKQAEGGKSLNLADQPGDVGEGMDMDMDKTMIEISAQGSDNQQSFNSSERSRSGIFAEGKSQDNKLKDRTNYGKKCVRTFKRIPRSQEVYGLTSAKQNIKMRPIEEDGDDSIDDYKKRRMKGVTLEVEDLDDLMSTAGL